MTQTRTPLTLLSGFLGSGKTTLIARLIRQPGFSRTAVIVNEFGAVGIDDALIAKGSEDNVVLLDSGCICCSLTSSLEDTLEQLYYRRERGELPYFDRVVVETTGLADPGPIAASLAAGVFVSRYFQLAGIVITVDLQQGHAQLLQHQEARHQVAMADRLILTKADVATPDSRQQVLAALAALNASAPTLEAIHGDIDPERLFAPVARLPALAGDGVRPQPGCAHCAAGIAHSHTLTGGLSALGQDVDRDGGLHGHGYVSVAIQIPARVSWERYALWVRTLQQRAHGRLLRTKGWLRFESGELMIIQGVGIVFTDPVPAIPDPGPGAPGTLVLIARGVAGQELETWTDVLQSCDPPPG